jgi:hypothetical protein
VLRCLTARFPFQSSSRPVIADSGGFLSRMMPGKKVAQVALTTTWFDAFRHSNRVQAVDVEFERLSVLFNCAALYSRQATQIKTAPAGPSSDGSSALQSASLKEACRLFQLSAGIFSYMASLPEITSGVVGAGMSLDLQADGLSMLAALMLAQAQACFFEAATNTASPKLVAKLAMGCSALFQEAHIRCEKVKQHPCGHTVLPAGRASLAFHGLTGWRRRWALAPAFFGRDGVAGIVALCAEADAVESVRCSV